MMHEPSFESIVFGTLVVEVGVCRARTCLRAAAAVVRRAILDSICFCVCCKILIFFLIDPKNK